MSGNRKCQDSSVWDRILTASWCKTMGMLPDSPEDLPLVAAFFQKAKLWKPDTCPCKHIYIEQVIFNQKWIPHNELKGVKM